MKHSLLFIFISLTWTAMAQSNRPQEPKAPFNYRSQEVVFTNEVDSAQLAGTLTYPKKGKNFPAVILISGSGAQDRNSELMNHKPFWVIADYLTRNGIAVLRVDDRGAGDSEGEYNETSLSGFTNDAQSAFDFLKQHKKVDPSTIGLIGHSLGGAIAPWMASMNSDIAFIVMLAGPGLRGDKLMLLQKELIERSMSVPEAAIELGQKNMGGAYDIILESTDDHEQLEGDLKAYLTEIFGKMLPESQIETLAQQLSYPWLADFIKFDPQIPLSNVKCPVLAMNGEKDLQVPSKQNLEAIEMVLKGNRNEEVTIVELENLNHLFQECETGLPTEYAEIEQTFSPDALKIMGDWILKHTK